MKIVGLLIAFFGPMFITGLPMAFSRKLRESKGPYPKFVMYTIANWVSLFLLWLIVRKTDLNLNKIGLTSDFPTYYIWIALALFVVGIAWYSFSKYYFKKIGFGEMSKELLYEVKTPGHVLILFVYAVITAAFCEEIFYRGFAITVIGGWLANVWIAGIISLLAFTFLHLPFYGKVGAVQIGIWGIIPTGLFILTGSILPGLIAHMLNNFVAYILRPKYFPDKM